MEKLLKSCPVCEAPLLAVRLECPACGTAIEGKFELAGLSGLAPQQLQFVEVFLRNRGTIRDVEAELGVSYPTVRAMLDDVVAAMQRKGPKSPGAGADARRILHGLGAGEFDVDHAIKKLEEIARSTEGGR